MNPSQLLTQEIKKRKLSIRKAAPSFGVPFQQLHTWQSGEIVISTDILIRIALKAPEGWARQFAWRCLHARYPGVFVNQP